METKQSKILENLNPEQTKAVKHKDGPLLIIAGAGSGKTKVLTCRTAYLISQGIAPENILAVTFTNKAANELKSRINKLVSSKPTSGTFHSICTRILRSEIKHLGLNSDFTIFDQADQKALLKHCIKELKIDDKRFSPQILADKISRLKDSLIEPSADKNTTRSFWEDQVDRVYLAYASLLKKNNGLDFGDLILMTVKLFRSKPDILTRYQETYRYILVDEYQDTNYAQYMFIKLLADRYKNICVVGDPDQSIYSWRGADISNILMFEKDYPKTITINLEENYRSTQNILDASNKLISHNTNRKPKNLWSNNKGGQLISYYEALNEKDEANHIVQKVIDLKQKQGFDLKDIVIFYRVHAQSRVFEDFLRRYFLAYKIVGGISFYARREIKDIIAYLRAINNPDDDMSCIRIINSPTRGIGKTTLDKLQSYQSKKNISLIECIKNIEFVNDIKTAAKKKLTGFLKILDDMKAHSKNLSVPDLLHYVIKTVEYEEFLLLSDPVDGQDRIENIRELVSSAAEMELEEGNLTLDKFLEHTALSSHSDLWKNDLNSLTLMTLHSAKGLEFPAVFIVGMEESLLPHANSFHDPDSIEEERRLCYVGLTRAKKIASFSSAISRIYNGKLLNNFPSRFIREIPARLLEREHNPDPITLPRRYNTSSHYY